MRLRLAAALCLLVVGGCQLGERPSFNTDPLGTGALTGDANADSVLDKFDALTKGPLTATYTVQRKYDPLDFDAEVILSGGRRRVTVGNTRIVEDSTGIRTCTVDGSEPCVAELQLQRLSAAMVTVDFYSAEAATRLRRDVLAKVAPTTLHAETLAGVAATCVDVPLQGGTATYCATDSGVVALQNDGDVLVTLNSIADSADETAFNVQ